MVPLNHWDYIEVLADRVCLGGSYNWKGPLSGNERKSFIQCVRFQGVKYYLLML